MYVNHSEDGAEQRRADEQQLLRNYSILKMNEFKPKNAYLHKFFNKYYSGVIRCDCFKFFFT